MARRLGMGLKRSNASAESGARPACSADDCGEVARVAYELFERRGRVHGSDLADWLEAERIVQQRRRARTSS